MLISTQSNHSRWISYLDFSALLFLVFLMTGCGSEPTPPEEKLVSASGVVKVNGKPGDGVRLFFSPTGDTKGVGGCWALCDSEGKFKVIHSSSKEGIPVGAYQVTFSKWLKPDGSTLGEKDSPTMVNAKQMIAARWSDMQNVGPHNRTEIPASGTSTLEFNIDGVK